ncbi:MAG: hypothetical protein LLG20_09790 [Acidobacteriales bacterium]|nr:hypothetical protein [Terriglobales bacterium]
MTTRRQVLASTFGAALAGARPLATPRQIRAFCIDFNWYKGVFAPPGHWNAASPEEHVRWYEALGANTIQTFCVSCNGYAWYKGGFVPPQPGLKHDFLTDVVRLGHKRGTLVMGYFCVGANSKWGGDHPELSYGVPGNVYHIPFTDAYLDYLARSMTDAIRRTHLDGYMIDWVWNPHDKLRVKGWIEAEKQLFTQLTRVPFPTEGEPQPADKLAYERRAIERAWERIHEARDRANPACRIWLSCSRLNDPTVQGSKMLNECDWVMNEAPNRALLEGVRKMVGSRTRLIQNLVGWPGHDAKAFLANPANRGLDFYGFAEPRDTSLPLPVEEYLAKSEAAFAGKDRFTVNDRNIATLARFYRELR